MADEGKRAWWLDIQEREHREIEDDEGSAIMYAVSSMLRGELSPLAEYLRAGYPLNYMVRRQIVEAIEGSLGNGLYTLKLVKNRRGSGTALTPLNAFTRSMGIAIYINEQLPLLNNEVEAAVHAAMKEFGISRATAMNARKFHKEFVKNWPDLAVAEAQKSKQKPK